MTTKKQLAIIGNGMATSRLLDDLLQRGATQRYAVTVFSEEKGGCYNRILLSKVLAGEEPDAIVLKSPDWYTDNGVRFVSGVQVTRLDTTARQVLTSDEKCAPLRLGRPRHRQRPVRAPDRKPEPPRRQMEGRPHRLPHAGGLHADAVARRPGDNAVVLGGGLLGLEAAKALSDLGLHVTIVDLAETLMVVQLDRMAGEMLRRQIERCGIFVRTGRSTKAVLGTDAVEGVVLDDGTTLPADLLVLACGIRPRVDVAKASNIPVKKGVLVNDTLATPVPGVYAIGECAEHAGRVYGIVAPIWEQATILADVLTGANPKARYRGSKLYTRLKVAGVEVASMGLVEPALDSDEVLQVVEERKSAYRKIISRDGRLVGAMLVGDTEAAAGLVQILDRGDPLPTNRLEAFCSPVACGGLGAADRQICNCHQVAETVIVEAIKEGAFTVDMVGESTRAGTGCGSCRGLLTQIIGRHVDPEYAVNGSANGH